MWILKDESGTVYKLGPNEPFFIGRNAGNLILKSDASISRNHAKISFLEATKKCLLTDLKSKYGTYLLDENSKVVERITDNYEVRPNDKVRFGLQNSILTFYHEIFVVLTSSLTPKDKEELAELIPAVGGKIVKEWSNDCTHLTVSSSKLTAKLSCALAAAIPVVKTSFWRAMKSSQEAGSEPPDPTDFCPPLDDLMLQTKSSFLPLESRRTIFKDMLFVHFRQNQLETYKTMITLAGGRSVFYGSKSFHKELLLDDNTRLVLFNEDDSQTEPYKVPTVASIQAFLKKHKRRLIPDCEIPLAILYSSVDKQCNPSFSYQNLLKTSKEATNIELGQTLAQDTQDLLNSKEKERFVADSVILPETETFESSQSTKDKRESKSEDESEENAFEECLKVEKYVSNDRLDDFLEKNPRKRLSEDKGDEASNKRLRINRSPLRVDKSNVHKGRNGKNKEEFMDKGRKEDNKNLKKHNIANEGDKPQSKRLNIGKSAQPVRKNDVNVHKCIDSDNDNFREEENVLESSEIGVDRLTDDLFKLPDKREEENLKKNEEERTRIVRELVFSLSQKKLKKKEDKHGENKNKRSGEQEDEGNEAKRRKIWGNDSESEENRTNVVETEETQGESRNTANNEDWPELDDNYNPPEEEWMKCNDKKSTFMKATTPKRKTDIVTRKKFYDFDDNWIKNLQGDFCGIPLRDLAKDDRHLLRREIFTGEFFGKTFKKLPVGIPRRISLSQSRKTIEII